MPSRNLSLPYFPLPPTEYSQEYLAEIVRQFTVYLQQQQNPGDARFTEIVLTNLQHNDVGLADGAVYKHGGVLRITELHTSAPSGIAASAALGSVTVSV